MTVEIEEGAAWYHIPAQMVTVTNAGAMTRVNFESEPGRLAPLSERDARKDEIELHVRVRVRLLNSGSAPEALVLAHLSLGHDDGVAMEEAATTGVDGKLFGKCDVAPDQGFEVLNLYFLFGGRRYYSLPGFDYGKKPHYTLELRTSRGAEFRWLLAPVLDPKLPHQARLEIRPSPSAFQRWLGRWR